VRKRFWLELSIVVALLVLALAVRLYLLPTTPPGLHNDEAANGLDVQDVLHGSHPIFFDRNNCREPLFIYLQAISVALLGATPYALRVTSAVVGALTVPVVYWMVREALAGLGESARWPALWTALFVAVSYWHINFSRIGYRAIMLPLLASIACAWFWRGWYRLDRRGRLPWRDLVLCGVFVGASLYTYTAARFLPGLIVVLAFAGSVSTERYRVSGMRVAKSVMVIAITALIVFAPLGAYYLNHPASFFERAVQLAVVSPQSDGQVVLPAVGVLRTVAMFAVGGDPNPRHNPAGRPLFDPMLAGWLIGGVALALVRRRSLPHLFGLIWVIVFVLPAALTVEGAPHSLRAIGAIPGAYLLATMAMWEVGKWLATRRQTWLSRHAPALAALLQLPFLLFSGYSSLRDYFGPWEHAGIHPPSELSTAFNSESGQAAVALAQQGRPDAVWIIPVSRSFLPRKISDFTLDFMYQGQGGHGVVANNEIEAPAVLNRLAEGRRFGYLVHWENAALLPLGAYKYADPKHFLDFLLNKYWRKVTDNTEGPIPYTTYELPAAPDYQVASEFVSQTVSFGGKVRLVAAAYGHVAIDRTEGASVLEGKQLVAGQAAWAALHWQPLVPISDDLKVSLRLLDSSGHLAGQVDYLLVSDVYPFIRTWAAGEPAGTYHILPTLPGVRPGSYQLVGSVYDDQTGQFYPATGSDGKLSSSYTLGHMEITRSNEPQQVIPAYPLPTSALSDSDLSLLGFDLPVRQANPGDTLPLTLYWQAHEQPEQAHIATYELVAVDAVDPVIRQSAAVGGPYPTTQWRAGETIRDWEDLPLPATLAAGSYRLVVRVNAGERPLGQVELGTIQVTGRPRIFTRPDITHSTSIAVGSSIVLAGYDQTSDTIMPGDTLKLTLYWRPGDAVREKYAVFVHLLGPDGRIWGQRDQTPGAGSLPTSGWVAGEYIIDAYQVEVRSDAPPGIYRIEIGMYDPVTGARQPIADAQGMVAGDSILLDHNISVRP